VIFPSYHEPLCEGLALMKSVQYMGMVVENRAVLGYDKRKSCSTWVSEKKIVQYMGMRKENGAVHGYEERKSCSTWV